MRIAASRWRRGEIFAAKISEERFGRTEKEKAKLREERNAAKQMEATYWLEMVDSKHRYAFFCPTWPSESHLIRFRRWQVRVESQVVSPEVERKRNLG